MTARLLLRALVLLSLWPAQVYGACVESHRGSGQTVGYDFIKLTLSGFSQTQRDQFEAGMERWNKSSCNTGGVAAPSFPYFTTEDPPAEATSRTISVVLTQGFNPDNNQSCGHLGGTQISLYTQAKKPTGETISCTSSIYFTDNAAHELGHTLGLKDQYSSSCIGYAMSQIGFSSSGVYQPRSVKSAECSKVRDTNTTPSELNPPPTPWCFSKFNCTGSRPYCVNGNCVECIYSYQCNGTYLTTPALKFEGAEFVCSNYVCVLASPLVIYLPDYRLPIGKPQSWWRSVCDPDAPTVCLDWWGDGSITCTGWTAPDNEDVGFIAALSEEYLASLASGPLPVEPSLHLFGNVTRGPDGGFPFLNGFDALASFCGQPGASEIDLSSCGKDLVVWVDDGDGAIAADELQPFDALGVGSLGQVRQVGKRDSCGNLDLFESHAKCVGHPGRCGTWIDIYFAAR